MENPLNSLKIDHWYKIFPVIGTITLVLSLTVEVKVFDNITVAMISIGIIFVGIGEWINHPLQTGIIPGYKITSYNRQNTFWGNAWDIFGLGIIIYGMFF